MHVLQKRFKRLKRIQDEESEEEQDDQNEDERDAIANEIFDGGSEHVCNLLIHIVSPHQNC